jgi:hypothetical protein
MILPPEIIAIITLYTGDIVVSRVLRKYMTPAIYRSILLTKRRILVHGQVQSGKTDEIMKIIQKPLYSNITKIIVVQNSLLVLSQYKERLSNKQIQHTVIDQNTKTLDKDVVILMNNTHRYQHYLRAQQNTPKQKPYIVIMDEADAYQQHVLATNAIHEYYVTATPYNPIYTAPEFFHHIQHIAPPENYQGLRDINITYKDAPLKEIVNDFHTETKEKGGIMLINSLQYVVEMQGAAKTLSQFFPKICFITLNDTHRLYLRGKYYKLGKRSITKLIDFFKDAPHIVFIANRMSLRGLSYTSGNYTRHLTHQYSDLHKKNVTNALQRMRIFGIYRDKQPVKLILPENNRKTVDKMFNSLDIDFKLNTYFSLYRNTK